MTTVAACCRNRPPTFDEACAAHDAGNGFLFQSETMDAPEPFLPVPGRADSAARERWRLAWKPLPSGRWVCWNHGPRAWPSVEPVVMFRDLESGRVSLEPGEMRELIEGLEKAEMPARAVYVRLRLQALQTSVKPL